MAISSLGSSLPVLKQVGLGLTRARALRVLLYLKPAVLAGATAAGASHHAGVTTQTGRRRIHLPAAV